MSEPHQFEAELTRVERRLSNMWEDARAEWGDACGGPAKHEIFAQKILSAVRDELRAIPPSPSTASEVGELPPLPHPFGSIYIYEDSGRVRSVDGFTADQMRGFAIDYGMKLGRAALAAKTAQPHIDYKLLLAKYIEHVGAEEGNTFINRLYVNDDGIYEGYSDKASFSKDEITALLECDQYFCNDAAIAATQSTEQPK